MEQLNSPKISKNKIDWRDGIPQESFYGREKELEQLSKWVATPSCSLVTIVGMGGIGKTALAVKLVESVEEQYEYIIWHSLRDAPLLENVIREILQFLSQKPDEKPPNTLKESLKYLIGQLAKHRCLIILDNFDALYAETQTTHNYSPIHEKYAELLKQVAELPHQSCFVITSREKPRKISVFEGNSLSAHSLLLSGLNSRESEQILKDKGLLGTSEQISELAAYYRGNPLFLKIAASTIIEVFGGNIENFLEQAISVIDGIDTLLTRELQRLSSLEWQVMFWLTIKREPVSFPQLLEAIFPQVSQRDLLKALESLGRRSLIEATANGKTQQPVIMEFLTERLLEKVVEEIQTVQLNFLYEYPLLEAQSKDYIRESQIRTIVHPLVEKLLFYFNNPQNLSQHLLLILSSIKNNPKKPTAYAIGNLLNLFRLLKTDLTGVDLSGCQISQAYLPDFSLHQANLTGANLKDCVLAESFGSVVSVDFSADGNFLVSSGTKGEICLWQTSDFSCVLKITEAHHAWAFQVKLTPDNQRLISIGLDGVKVWDARTGGYMDTLGFTQVKVIALLDLSSNGEIVAYLDQENRIVLQMLTSGVKKLTFQGSEKLNRLALAPNDQFLATGSEDGNLQLWDINTGECLKTIPAHQETIWAIAFSRDGRYLASGGSDGFVKLWDIDSGECRYTWKHRDWVMCVAFPQTHLLASAGGDSTICIWNLETGECEKLLHGHNRRVWSLASGLNGLLASGGDDQLLKVWDINTGRSVKTLQGYTDAIWSIALSGNGRMLATGEDNCCLRLWDLSTQECVQVLKEHSDRIECVAFSPDGNWLASVSDDQTIKLWKPELSRSVITLKLENAHCRSICFSPNGQFFVTCSTDALVRLWSLKGACLKTLSGHEHWTHGLAFDNQGKILITGSIDGMIKFWDIATGECLKTWKDDYGVGEIALSPDNRYLASCHYAQQPIVKLWDIETGECIQIFSETSAAAFGICFSHDGKLIFSAASNDTIRISDVHTGECLQILSGHTKHISSVLLTSDGSTLITSSFDETIRFWDVSTGQCQKILRVKRPYEGMNITDVSGLTQAQKLNLIALGAFEHNWPEK